ncbi:MAG TPA: septal ring lytic transglycosylase RlpA family protein [Burkholderiaceae bacterium]|nr:septal ring lytic transglycosylase RlpA family protein [Burkholderiaceae bacterium]
MRSRLHPKSQRLLRWLTMAVPALILAACGSVPPQPSATRPASTPAPTASAATRPLPVLPPAGSGRGGYYLDDGPGDAPPDGLLAIPDAVPKIEPYAKATLRPYVVFGKTYTPITDERPLKQRGVGSWYGKKFHGQKTSSGELYDMYQMTAAHPTLPLPSYARVTNLKTGVQVIVRVNDRGPFRSDRVIDLSYTAALKLGYLTHGSTELEVERLLPDEILRMAAQRQDSQNSEAPALASIETPLQERTVVAEQRPPLTLIADAPAAPSITPAAGGGFYLQLGAYSQAANAEALRARLAQNWAAGLPLPEVVQYGALFRVHSGPFASRYDAASAARQVPGAGAAQPMIVQR